MKKIIEFFNSLFGKKRKYVFTKYASPIEQLVEAKKETKKKPTVKKVQIMPKKSKESNTKKNKYEA